MIAHIEIRKNFGISIYTTPFKRSGQPPAPSGNSARNYKIPRFDKKHNDRNIKTEPQVSLTCGSVCVSGYFRNMRSGIRLGAWYGWERSPTGEGAGRRSPRRGGNAQ